MTITPGATAAVSLPMPKVAVTVEGPEGADLIVDGEPMGKLPLTGLQVPLGTRDFVIKHPDHGEKRQVVTVTNHAPMRVTHALTRAGPTVRSFMKPATRTVAGHPQFALHPRAAVLPNCTCADRWTVDHASDRLDRVSAATGRPDKSLARKPPSHSRWRWSLSSCPNPAIARLSE